MSATPIIPWIGGKRRLAKVLLPLFPAHTCYVEPFCGAAALFFMKEPAETEVLNDINGDLIRLYRVVQHHLEEFIRQFKWALVSREMFKWLQITPPETLTDIQRAARFYYLQRQCFGGKVESQSFGMITSGKPRLNLLRIEEDLSQAHLRLSQVLIENRPWYDVAACYDRPHTLTYMDPPYWGTAGYGVDFGLEQYDRMAALAKAAKGKMLISVNDIPEMRKAFKGLAIQRTEIAYSVAGGGKSEKTGELIIRNWK